MPTTNGNDDFDIDGIKISQHQAPRADPGDIGRGRRAVAACLNGPVDRRFYIVWSGQLLSGVGSSLTGFGVAFWVYIETDSATWLAVMFGAAAVPRLVATPLTGVVDRLNRRTVMIAADTAAVAATGVVVALWLRGDLVPWHLALSTAVGAFFASFQQPAYTAALPTLVDDDHLDRANGLIQLGPSIGAVVVPGLAGALVAWVGIGSIFVVDLVTFVIGITTVASVKFGAVTGDETDESYSLAVAARWLRSEGRSLVALTLVLAAANVALAGAGVAMIARARDLAGDAAIGLGPTAGGVGMVVVSLIIGARGLPERRIPVVGLALVGLGLMLALSVATTMLVLFVVSVGLALSTMPLLVTAIRTTFHRWTPHHLQGRVFGIIGAVATVAEPIGLGLAVPLVEWSAAGYLALAGAVVVVFGAAAAASPMLRALDGPPPTAVAAT